MKKFISWNINGLRACVKKGFFDFLDKEKPDILAVQEIKAQHDQIAKIGTHPNGYDVVMFQAKRPGYSGVGVYVKKGEEYEVEKGMGVKDFDIEGRTLAILLRDLVFVTAYFPNSQVERARLDYKLAFCKEMRHYLDSYSKKGKKVLLCGDYNIAHKELDLTHPKENHDSPGFYPEEREWMDSFIGKDYIDTFWLFNKEGGNYTWWSYRTNARSRNVGWRIDYHCVNKKLSDGVVKSYHNSDVMGSDHCPVSIILNT